MKNKENKELNNSSKMKLDSRFQIKPSQRLN